MLNAPLKLLLVVVTAAAISMWPTIKPYAGESALWIITGLAWLSLLFHAIERTPLSRNLAWQQGILLCLLVLLVAGGGSGSHDSPVRIVNALIIGYGIVLEQSYLMVRYIRKPANAESASLVGNFVITASGVCMALASLAATGLIVTEILQGLLWPLAHNSIIASRTIEAGASLVVWVLLLGEVLLLLAGVWYGIRNTAKYLTRKLRDKS